MVPGCLRLSAEHGETIGGTAAVRHPLREEGGHLRFVGEVDEQLPGVECVVGQGWLGAGVLGAAEWRGMDNQWRAGELLRGQLLDTVSEGMPSCSSATRTALEAPPLPRISAQPGRVPSPTSSLSEVAKPSTSVL